MIEKPFPFVKKRRQADVSPCQSGFLPSTFTPVSFPIFQIHVSTAAAPESLLLMSVYSHSLLLLSFD